MHINRLSVLSQIVQMQHANIATITSRIHLAYCDISVSPDICSVMNAGLDRGGTWRTGRTTPVTDKIWRRAPRSRGGGRGTAGRDKKRSAAASCVALTPILRRTAASTEALQVLFKCFRFFGFGLLKLFVFKICFS